MKEKIVLIKEHHALKRVDEAMGVDGNSTYTFKAPVALFGKKNNNMRVYEEANYLPLMEELKTKIQGNNLTGELDHPGERLEVFLGNVSHKIEELWYDESTRTVNAKIKIIEGTVAGNNAKALIDSGVELGISSRAVGVIKEGKALLKKIITYDLVSTPGFTEAMLKPMNESLGYDSVEESNIAIYEITDQKILDKYKNIINTETSKNMDTKDIMEVKAEMNSLKEAVSAIKESIEGLNDQFDVFSKYNESETEKLNQLVEEVNKVGGGLPTEINDEINEMKKFRKAFSSYNEQETLKMQNLKQNVSSMEDTVSEFMDLYNDYTVQEAEKLNAFVNHNESETIKLNQLVEHLDGTSENMQKMVEHNERETGKLNSLVEFINNTSDKMQLMVEHNSNETTKFNHLVNYINKNFGEVFENLNFKKEINNKTVDVDITNITESVDTILANVRKQKVLQEQVYIQYPFLEKLNDEKVDQFLKLEESRKIMIKESVSSKGLSEEATILEAWEDVEKQVSISGSSWLVDAPENYQKIWVTLSESQKIKVTKLADMREFKTTADISRFWDDFNFSEKVIKESMLISETLDLENTLEQQKNIKKQAELGYSQEYVEHIKELVKRNK